MCPALNLKISTECVCAFFKKITLLKYNNSYFFVLVLLLRPLFKYFWCFNKFFFKFYLYYLLVMCIALEVFLFH